MSDVLVRKVEVLRRLGVSRSTLGRMMLAGTFPRGLIVTGNARRWSLQTVDEFLARIKKDSEDATGR